MSADTEAPNEREFLEGLRHEDKFPVADTDALLATVREGLLFKDARAAAALDSLAAELERVKAERDGYRAANFLHVQTRAEAAEARLDKALSALRDAVDVATWLTGATVLSDVPAWPEMREKLNAARAAIAEIEGEPAMVSAEREAILRGPDAPAAEIEGET